MIIIYTAIYGDYDELRQPVVADTSIAEWICVTDSDKQAGGIWKNRRVPCTLSNRRCARRAKILYHLLFKDDIIIWHGGNVQLRGDLTKLVASLGSADIAVLQHNHRDCAYAEAEACKQWGLDSTKIIDAQMNRYRSEGFPENYGLSAAFLIVRRNTQKVREFCALWWDQVNNGSYRDQLSFDYCRWKTGIKVATIPGNIFEGPFHKRFPTHRG